MNKRKFQVAITLLFFALLFLFPDVSFEGAKKGLLLWFQIVLPTLLPFLIFSNLMFRLKITRAFSVFLYPALKKIMPISPDGCYPVAVGLLSGYPMGAKACADMASSGSISPWEGQFLLSFCNNASPMFLLNYMMVQSLHIQKGIPALMGILLFSSLLCGYVYFFFHRDAFAPNRESSPNRAAPTKKETSLAPASSEASFHKPAYFQVLDLSIMNSFEVITKIGGYIILFSLLANLIASQASLPFLPKAVLIGGLEVTTGIQYIASSSLEFPAKLLLAMSLSAFGGLSSVAQTGSVLLGSPLKLGAYIKYKLLNSLICCLLTLLYLYIA